MAVAARLSGPPSSASMQRRAKDAIVARNRILGDGRASLGDVVVASSSMQKHRRRLSAKHPDFGTSAAPMPRLIDMFDTSSDEDRPISRSRVSPGRRPVKGGSGGSIGKNAAMASIREETPPRQGRFDTDGTSSGSVTPRPRDGRGRLQENWLRLENPPRQSEQVLVTATAPITTPAVSSSSAPQAAQRLGAPKLPDWALDLAERPDAASHPGASTRRLSDAALQVLAKVQQARAHVGDDRVDGAKSAAGPKRHSAFGRLAEGQAHPANARNSPRHGDASYEPGSLNATSATASVGRRSNKLPMHLVDDALPPFRLDFNPPQRVDDTNGALVNAPGAISESALDNTVPSLPHSNSFAGTSGRGSLECSTSPGASSSGESNRIRAHTPRPRRSPRWEHLPPPQPKDEPQQRSAASSPVHGAPTEGEASPTTFKSFLREQGRGHADEHDEPESSFPLDAFVHERRRSNPGSASATSASTMATAGATESPNNLLIGVAETSERPCSPHGSVDASEIQDCHDPSATSGASKPLAAVQERSRMTKESLALEAWRPVAAETARQELEAALEAQLQIFAQMAQRDAENEVAPEIERVHSVLASKQRHLTEQRARRPPPSTSLGRLRRELLDATERSHMLWASIEAQADMERARRAAEETVDVACSAESELQDQASLRSWTTQAAELGMQVQTMEEDLASAARAAQSFSEQANELQQEVDRLLQDREAAAQRMHERRMARLALWSRLEALAAKPGYEPKLHDLQHVQIDEATLLESARRVGDLWAEAWARGESCAFEQSALDATQDELNSRLSLLQEAVATSSQTLAAAEHELDAQEWERKRQQGLIHEEFRAARRERDLLRQSRAEWQRSRPQLAALVEEVRGGSEEAAASHRELQQQLAALQNSVPATSRTSVDAIEANGQSNGQARSCSSSVERGGGFSSPHSSGSERERQRDDGALAVATEERNVLAQRMLALEEEKASLINEQEELIRYIKAKVEPLQRALGID